MENVELAPEESSSNTTVVAIVPPNHPPPPEDVEPTRHRHDGNVTDGNHAPTLQELLWQDILDAIHHEDVERLDILLTEPAAAYEVAQDTAFSRTRHPAALATVDLDQLRLTALHTASQYSRLTILHHLLTSPTSSHSSSTLPPNNTNNTVADEESFSVWFRPSHQLNTTLSINRIDAATGRTALHWACSTTEGTAAIAYLLRVSGINVNAQARDGYTALHVATDAGLTAAVRILLQDARLDVNIQDCHGQSALFLAACDGHTAIVQLLLHQCPEVAVNTRDKHGCTPLYMACLRQQVAVVQALLKHPHVDIHATTSTNLQHPPRTVLDVAVAHPPLWNIFRPQLVLANSTSLRGTVTSNGKHNQPQQPNSSSSSRTAGAINKRHKKKKKQATVLRSPTEQTSTTFPFHPSPSQDWTADGTDEAIWGPDDEIDDDETLNVGDTTSTNRISPSSAAAIFKPRSVPPFKKGTSSDHNDEQQRRNHSVPAGTTAAPSSPARTTTTAAPSLSFEYSAGSTTLSSWVPQLSLKDTTDTDDNDDDDDTVGSFDLQALQLENQTLWFETQALRQESRVWKARLEELEYKLQRALRKFAATPATTPTPTSNHSKS